MPVDRKQKLRILCVVPVWNEEKRVGTVVRSIPKQSVDLVLVVDDGSSDKTVQAAKEAGAFILHHDSNRGVGAAIRSGIEFARREKFDVAVVVSGSGKTPCEQIPKILEPIIRGKADVVQGSRYIFGGQFVHAPVHRRIGTSAYTKLFSLFVGRRISDASCGFRAFRMGVVLKGRWNLFQEWLDRYELEPYLLFNMLKSSCRVLEIPVAVVYPPKHDDHGYTKMRMVIDWWRIFRPVLFLATGFKK